VLSSEGQKVDKKSIRSLQDPDALAKDCVAFANARGGCLMIGIEDGEFHPPPDQTIDLEACSKLEKRLSQITLNTGVSARKLESGAFSLA